MKFDTVACFSSKAERYAKSRPDYASEAIQTIFEQTKLTPESVVADIGSGTGIVSQHFIKNGNRVYAVEPNSEMRQVAETALGKYPNFQSVDGNSEQTTLPDASIDLITVGQAIHWFDGEPSKREFLRVLKPSGWFSILQNAFSRFDLDLSNALEFAAQHRGEPQNSNRPQNRPYQWWFAQENELIPLQFSNPHVFDREGFIGLMLSKSPSPDESRHAFSAYVDALQSVFEKFQINGRVTINYTTHLYLGKIGR